MSRIFMLTEDIFSNINGLQVSTSNVSTTIKAQHISSSLITIYITL